MSGIGIIDAMTPFKFEREETAQEHVANALQILHGTKPLEQSPVEVNSHLLDIEARLMQALMQLRKKAP